MNQSLFDLRFLPDLLLYGISISLIFASGALIVHLYSTQDQLLPFNEPAGARFGFMEPVLAVVILFGITLSWLNYGELQNTVGEETVRINLLGRSALSLEEPRRTRLTRSLADYARSISESEWLNMRLGERSYATSDALTQLIETYDYSQGEGYREQSILLYSKRLLRELAEFREQRLAAAQYPLAGSVQQLFVFMLGATLAISWFFGLPSLATKLVLGTLFTWSLAVLLTFNDILTHPFAGAAALDSSAYTQVADALLSDLSHIDGGPF